MTTIVRRNRAPRLVLTPARSLLALVLFLYLALALYQWDRPTPDPDELLDAVPAMQFLLGQPLDNHAVIRFAGREWPLMVMPYVGCMSTYLLLPAFSLLGVGVFSLRLTGVLLGLVSLLLAWGFLREFLDERVATLSVLLLAISPSCIFWTRMNAYVALPLWPLALITLWSLYRWYRRGVPGYLVALRCCGNATRHMRAVEDAEHPQARLVLAALALGLGLSTKILFLWLWAALGLAWLILSPWLQPGAGWRAWLWPLRRARLQTGVLSFLALLLGSGMFLAYNLRGGGTLRLMLQSLQHSQMFGVNNLDVLANLRVVVLQDFPTLLNGSWFVNHLGVAHRNPLALPAFIAALGAILALKLAGKLRYSTRRLGLLGILLVAIVAQSSFTVTGHGAHHLLILWPIPQAIVSVAILGLADAAQHILPARRRAVLASLVLITLALAGAELVTTWRYHQTLAQSGRPEQNPIYALARDLEQPGTPPVVALDWGFRRPLQFLTQGSVNPEEGYDYSSQPGEAARTFIDRRVSASPALYLFHSPAGAIFGGHLELFEETAYRHRLTPVLWKSYASPNGDPIYLVYRLEPAPHLFQAPAIQHPLSAHLGDSLDLLGYDLVKDTLPAGKDLHLTLYWQTRTRQTASYKVFVHLVDSGGQIAAQKDGVPVDWGYPTPEWQAGEIVPDRIRLSPDKPLPVGTYRLFAGMYDEASGERLPLIAGGQRQPDDRLEIAEITVTAPGGQ